MTKSPLNWAQRATRWWSAPARFSASALAALRSSSSAPNRRTGLWLKQTPVGIRSPFCASS